MLDRQWMLAHIPHQGSMCLLDAVESWDEETILCRAVSHTHQDNPLRAADRLGSVCLVEFAAQAMAIHSALLAGDAPPPKAGFLASLRDVRWFAPRIDDLTPPLRLTAQRLSGNDATALYRFEAHAGDLLLASGRISAVLDASAFAPPRPTS